MPQPAQGRRKHVPAKHTGPARAGAPAAKRHSANELKLQLKLKAGLESAQKKKIIDRVSEVTAGRVRSLFGKPADPELETYYVVDVPDAVKATKAIGELRGTKGVEVIAMPATRRSKTEPA